MRPSARELGARGTSFVFGCLMAASLCASACSASELPPVGGGAADSAGQGSDGGSSVDLGKTAGINACGSTNPTCKTDRFGPAFGVPLPMSPDKRVQHFGVKKDGKGHVVLDPDKATSTDFIWVANSHDYDRGTVSKIDARTRREVARYLTYTCASAEAKCAGGCCARDDMAAYGARKNNKPAGAAQAIQRKWNSPSRTAVDLNGDVWVANRAFSAKGWGFDGSTGQASVTKIANVDCVDRDSSGTIDTSRDIDGDGKITVDCDGDGVPDNRATKCTGGRKHEFYGADDECILFTTNIGNKGALGRPIALMPGPDGTSSDAWAGTYFDGRFYRIDGRTGKVKQVVKVGDCAAGKQAAPFGVALPYGAVIDKHGILWAPNNLHPGFGHPPPRDLHLFWFNTGKTSEQGCVQAPFANDYFYGVSLDPDQNLWLGVANSSSVVRYAPDRSQGSKSLSRGKWLKVNLPAAASHASVRGVAADNRKAPSFFVWVALDGTLKIGGGAVADGAVARVDTSKIPPNLANGAELTLSPGQGGDVYPLPGQRITVGVGVDASGHLWAVNQKSNNAMAIELDAAGKPTGKRTAVTLAENPGGSNPRPYTYSDFTGFGLRNFASTRGAYSFTHDGCKSGKTRWIALEWDADVPAQTRLSVSVRAAADGVTWGQPLSLSGSPAKLAAMVPNPSAKLRVTFEMSSQKPPATPALKAFRVLWECVIDVQ